MAKKETNKKENNKNKRSFFKDFKAELKRVVWPTPKQLLNNTVAVLTIVLITAAIVFVLDLTFEAINKHGIDKVKEVIGSNDVISENISSENTSTDETSENITELETTTEENVENNTENNAQ